MGLPRQTASVGTVFRRPLPARFQRWTVTLSPGESVTTSEGEWAGSIARIEQGEVEVGCRAGASRVFTAGDLLALSCLPLISLRNVGATEARIVAVRRSPPSR